MSQLPAGLFQLKTVLLGSSSVGKSSIALRFSKDQFFSEIDNTIGAAFMTKMLAVSPQTFLRFEIWDTAGQERYNSLAPMYYRGAHVAIVVYDITSRASFERAKKWFEEIEREEGPSGIVIAFVGNKCDLAANRQVDTNEGQAFADLHNIIFKETSAKENINITELFNEVALRIPFGRLTNSNSALNNPQNPHNHNNTQRCRCTLI